MLVKSRPTTSVNGMPLQCTEVRISSASRTD